MKWRWRSCAIIHVCSRKSCASQPSNIASSGRRKRRRRIIETKAGITSLFVPDDLSNQ
ncbi:hypothetical protein KCP78_16910 [Salmonella enterica subsp. enterica]|nr:hypothetical protein KCP78_16910 [Salmonella enterica subsp. enterica]